MNVERFTFYSMEERTPPKGVPVLVKFDEQLKVNACLPKYYVCYYVPASPYNVEYFCEASGEQYWTFNPARVIAWASIGMGKSSTISRISRV